MIVEVFGLEYILRFNRHPNVDEKAVGYHAREPTLSVFFVRDVCYEVRSILEL